MNTLQCRTLYVLCTTVCPVNEYVGGSPDACQPCPAMSSSPGGVVRVCPCMNGTGRVDESDPSLPCVGESLRLCLCNQIEVTLNICNKSHHTIICVYSHHFIFTNTCRMPYSKIFINFKFRRFHVLWQSGSSIPV